MKTGVNYRSAHLDLVQHKKIRTGFRIRQPSVVLRPLI